MHCWLRGSTSPCPPSPPRQLLHLPVLLLEPVRSAPLAQLEQRQLLRRIVHNQQRTLLGEAPDVDTERLLGDSLVDKHAVVDQQRKRIPHEPPGQRNRIHLDEVAFRILLPLQAQAHVDKDHHDENHSKSQYAIAYHKLLVSVQTMCHNKSNLEVRANVTIKIKPIDKHPDKSETLLRNHYPDRPPLKNERQITP